MQTLQSTTTVEAEKIHVPWGDCCERLSHDWQIVGPSQSTLGLLQVRDPVPCRHLHWPGGTIPRHSMYGIFTYMWLIVYGKRR